MSPTLVRAAAGLAFTSLVVLARVLIVERLVRWNPEDDYPQADKKKETPR